MNKIYQIKGFFLFKNIFRCLLICFFVGSQSFSASAQCPPNIDFELGDFTGWNYTYGNYSATGVIITPPTPTTPPPNPPRYEIISAASSPPRDQWGDFPVLCPNGSGYSVKFGNTGTGTTADRLTYTFTIPAGQNTFNLIYNYAIVINNAGGHPANIQPSLIVIVKNLTDNTTDYCSSDTIAYANTNQLPGFQDAPSNPQVKFKPWAARSIKLDGNAGKTIEISFTSTGCGAAGGQHFGYAYIDLNTECSSSIVGASYCPDDTAISVTAPFGYETYKWWDITDPSTILATTQTINFQPPPPAGTTLQVAITPFFGIYGCPDTLTVELLDTLNVFANAGPDKLSCQNAPVQLGVNPSPGFVYSWDPVTYLSDPTISNPVSTPPVTTQYVLTVRSVGGGCLTTDTVIVNSSILDTSLSVVGPLTGCILPSNPTLLKVNPADSIQWYRNTVPIPGANDTVLNVIQTGTYHATVFSFLGCDLTTTDVIITVNPTPIAGFTSNFSEHCFNNHQFVFTDTSSVAFGTMSYTWDMGDASPLLNTQNVNYSYAAPGTYTIKQLVVSDQGCTDSAFYDVTVFDSPVAAFDSDIKGTCFKYNQFRFTNSSTLAVGTMKYLWNFGDAKTDTARDVTHTYAAPGTYTVRLTTTSDKGCPNDSAFDVTVYPDPAVGFDEPNAMQCFGNNQFNFINSSTILTGSMGYAWYLGDGATAATRDVTHSYAGPGEFTVKMVALSDKGCTDSISKLFKVIKYAIADFRVDPVCTNLRLPLFNRTINTSPSTLTYLWEFGNGATSTVQNPVYSYPNAGTYTIKLTVSDINCPQTLSIKTQDVVIDAPLPGTRYPDVEAVMNFPQQLQSRLFTTSSVLWTPSVNLNFANSYRPTFKGLTPQLYYVQFKTRTGCLTVDTQYVKIKKKIEVYVPTSFTPDGNGLNDYLYPVLMGFQKLNYFRIFDRWGKMLFQSQSEQPGWNGMFNGEKVSLQTVIWMVEAVDVDGVTHKRQGTTVLLR